MKLTNQRNTSLTRNYTNTDRNTCTYCNNFIMFQWTSFIRNFLIWIMICNFSMTKFGNAFSFTLLSPWNSPLSSRAVASHLPFTNPELNDDASLTNSDDNLDTSHSFSPSVNSLDPTSYYADWDRLLNGYGSQRCYPIPRNMSLCQNVGYTQMILPNYLQHEDLKEAVDQSQIWLSLAQTECHPDLRKFLCSLYAPVCVDGHQERLIHPCQNLCEDVRRNCLPKMLQFGFGWPDIVKCSRFPTINSRMCVPLSQQTRPQCSGCVEEPKFESLISSYCMADVVFKGNIQHATRANHSTSKSYILYLDKRSKPFKPGRRFLNLNQLRFSVDCSCDILDKFLSQTHKRVGRWMIMGKLSADRTSVQVEHLSRIKRSNSGLKRALKAMRRSSPELCKLPHPGKVYQTQTQNRNAFQSNKASAQTEYTNIQNPTLARSSSTTSSRSQFQRSYGAVLNNKSTHTRAYRNINYGYPTLPRRQLVRRSQIIPAKRVQSPSPSPPPAPYLTTTTTRFSTPTKHIIYSPQLNVPTSKVQGSTMTMPFHQLSQTNPHRVNIPFESEKDLYSPQTILPWN